MGFETRDRILNGSRAHRLVAPLVFWATLFLVVIYDWAALRLRVEGRSRLRRLGPGGAFLISNHTLYLDPAIVAHAIAPRRTRFSALQETFSIPFVGNFIRYLGAFPIPQREGLLKLVRPIRALLQRGWLVHFFPEGDLALRNQELQPFSNGVFFFAQMFDRPVLPVTIVLLPRVLLGRRLSPRFYRVKAVIGEPIHPSRYRASGLGRREAIEAMARDAREAMAECIRRERAPYFPPAAGWSGSSTSFSGREEARAERSQNVG
jgi:1-acyl-sn-glycerol-3-phosphate acyltransferase